MRVQVQNGILTLTMQDNGEVIVDMGAPAFEPARVPFDAGGLEGRREGDDTLWPLEVNGATRWISVVSMGNPHAVQVVDDVEAFAVLVDGPLIEHHPRFAQRVNAGFMQIVAATKSDCVSTSAAPAKHWRAAQAHARRSPPAFAAGCSIRR